MSASILPSSRDLIIAMQGYSFICLDKFIEVIFHILPGGIMLQMAPLCYSSYLCGAYKLFANFQVRLIASVPGYHMGSNLRKWGHMKLRTVLHECVFDKEFQRSPLVYQVWLSWS